MMSALLHDLHRVARTDRSVAIYIAKGHGEWEVTLFNVITLGEAVLAPHHVGQLCLWLGRNGRRAPVRRSRRLILAVIAMEFGSDRGSPVRRYTAGLPRRCLDTKSRRI